MTDITVWWLRDNTPIIIPIIPIVKQDKKPKMTRKPIPNKIIQKQFKIKMNRKCGQIIKRK